MVKRTASILSFPIPPKGKYGEASRYYHAGDHVTAARILHDLVEDGLFNAHVFLSLIYRLGQGGVLCDERRAFRHAVAAVETVGHPEGYVFVAMHYAQGRGIFRDPPLAKSYYLAAFSKYSHPIAALGLGRLYESEDLGPPNLLKALAYYRLAERGRLSFASRYIARCLIKKHRYTIGIAYHIYATLRAVRLYREIGMPAVRTW
jgi:TPR repeat protein